MKKYRLFSDSERDFFVINLKKLFIWLGIVVFAVVVVALVVHAGDVFTKLVEVVLGYD